jgi:type I restriction enzyme M protein
MKGITLVNSDHDVKALAFQKFIHVSQRGSRGQFLTPAPAVELAVSICQPTPGDKVIDPACGTGSFLIQAYRNLSSSGNELSIVGADVNPGVLRLARMNFALWGIEDYDLVHVDSLSDWKDLPKQFGMVLYDDLFTNPPFGSQGKITDQRLLSKYELGHKWVHNDEEWLRTTEVLDNQTPQILFIERCLDLLEPGGQMAIVLPESIMQNPSLGYVRAFLQMKGELLAVVSLPQETFIPYGTGIKASIMCIRKKGGRTVPESIFFSEIVNIGYAGDKSASTLFKLDSRGQPVRDREGNPIVLEDISQVKELYSEFVKTGKVPRNDRCFALRRSLIQDRLDFEFYRPVYTQLEEQLRKAGAVALASVVKIKRSKVGTLPPTANVKYVEISDVDATTSEIIHFSSLKAHELPSRASFELRNGDILTAMSGISTGTSSHASAIVTEEHDGAICTSGFAVLVPIEVNPFYLLSFLRSKYFTMQMRRYRVGAAIPDVSNEDLKKVLIPRLEESIERRIGSAVEEGFRLRAAARERLSFATTLLEESLPRLPS